MLIEQTTDFGKVGTNYFVKADSLAHAVAIVESQHWREWQQFRSLGYTELRVGSGMHVRTHTPPVACVVSNPANKIDGQGNRRAIRRKMGR